MINNIEYFGNSKLNIKAEDDSMQLVSKLWKQGTCGCLNYRAIEYTTQSIRAFARKR